MQTIRFHERGESRLARNETRAGNLLLIGTVVQTSCADACNLGFFWSLVYMGEQSLPCIYNTP